jgi:hypothetical protein
MRPMNPTLREPLVITPSVEIAEMMSVPTPSTRTPSQLSTRHARSQ